MIESKERVVADAELEDLTIETSSPDQFSILHGNGAMAPHERADWLLTGADESFRTIYTRAGIEPQEVLAICSAIGGEGRTSLALGMGSTLAQDFPERRVLVVEADLKHPVLADDFGVPPRPGLVDCLAEGRPVSLAYRATSIENLDFLPAGGPLRDARRVLASSRMGSAIDAMRDTHDLIIIDTPAVLTSSDALLLGDLADGIIFVVRAGVTPLSLVHKAIGQLDEQKLLGFVLNDSRSSLPGWLRRLTGL